MGIGISFGIGPFRVYGPLRKRRMIWTHEGCAVNHRTEAAASEHAVKLARKRA